MALHDDDQRLVLGRYRIGGLLGRGGASQVHRAHDVQTGHDVAVKEIPIHVEMARRAGAEVRAASRLSHPGIVRLLDFGEDNAACYLVSELVEGASLADRSREGWTASHPGALIDVVADVLDGLAHAHDRGVTHRDVKPANILVDRAGRGRLTDFGIARIAGEAGLTTIGGLVGTVSYMAPEQARGDETGPAADVYSACLVLYEGLAGHNPLVGPSPGETLRRAASGRIPPLAQARPELPATLCKAIDSGLAPDPRARPEPEWMARTLRAQTRTLDGVGAPSHRFTERIATWANAAGGAVLVSLLLHQTTDLRPGSVALAAAAAAAGFAFLPWAAALMGLMGGTVALGMHSPGLAMLVGSLGLVALAPVRTKGRLVLLPATAPLLAAFGVVPVYAALAGAVRGWRSRVWAALTGLGATLIWQAVAGADPAVDGGRLTSAWADIDGVVSPLAVVQRVSEPLQNRPAVVIAAGVLAAASLVMPAIVRLRRGVPRAVGVAMWIIALIVCVRVGGGSVESAAGAFIPGGILVAAWAAGPWRRLRFGADRRRTVTLRSATVERLPAA